MKRLLAVQLALTISASCALSNPDHYGLIVAPAHLVGAPTIEPVPAGITDKTVWDTVVEYAKRTWYGASCAASARWHTFINLLPCAQNSIPTCCNRIDYGLTVAPAYLAGAPTIEPVPAGIADKTVWDTTVEYAKRTWYGTSCTASAAWNTFMDLIPPIQEATQRGWRAARHHAKKCVVHGQKLALATRSAFCSAYLHIKQCAPKTPLV